MGYTHYFYREENLDSKLFDLASKDCQKVCNISDVEIQLEYNTPELPVFTKDMVRFNGVGDNGNETFVIERLFKSSYPQKNDKGQLFAFCKTACKPYDNLVTACLVIFKHYFGESITVSSDGELADWKSGMSECQKVLGYGLGFKLED